MDLRIIGIVVVLLLVLIGFVVYMLSGPEGGTNTQITPVVNSEPEPIAPPPPSTSSPLVAAVQDTVIPDPPPAISSVTPEPVSTPTPPQAQVPVTQTPPPVPNCTDPVSYYYFYNPDVKAAGVDALAHWNSSGYKEGRKSCFAPPPPPNLSFLDSSGAKASPYMRANDKLLSTDGRWSLIMQTNGNLVGTTVSNPMAFWWTSKSADKGKPPYTAVMQPDGNFVIYDSVNKAVWNTGSGGKTNPPYQFNLQTDRNLVIYDSKGKAVWNSGTNA